MRDDNDPDIEDAEESDPSEENLPDDDCEVRDGDSSGRPNISVHLPQGFLDDVTRIQASFAKSLILPGYAEKIRRINAGLARSMVVPGPTDALASINTSLAASISKAFEFNSVFESIRPQLDLITKTWSQTWIKDLTETARRLLRAAWPPNLRLLADDLDLAEVLEFLEAEGIPLYVVPRAAALLAAKDTPARRALIGRRFDSLIEDCEEVLDRCTDPRTLSEMTFLRAAVAAVKDGHHAAGQALAANLLDSMLWSWFTKDERTHLTSHRKTPNGDVLTDEMALREAMVMLPIWAAHKTFERHKGDLVPHMFSRHASVHAVSGRQFNKRNAALALMLATSLVGFANGL